MDLPRRNVRSRIILVRAAELHFAETYLVSRAVDRFWLRLSSVAWQGLLVDGLTLQLSLMNISNYEVRLFKEFNAFRGQRELSVSAIETLVFSLVFSRRRRAPRTDFIVSRSDVVCDERRQRAVNLLGLLCLVVGVVTSGCFAENGCSRGSNHGRVGLNLALVCNHNLLVVGVRVEV